MFKYLFLLGHLRLCFPRGVVSRFKSDFTTLATRWPADPVPLNYTFNPFFLFIKRARLSAWRGRNTPSKMTQNRPRRFRTCRVPCDTTTFTAGVENFNSEHTACEKVFLERFPSILAQPACVYFLTDFLSFFFCSKGRLAGACSSHATSAWHGYVIFVSDNASECRWWLHFYLHQRHFHK